MMGIIICKWDIMIICLVVEPAPLKNMSDDEIPKKWKVIKVMFQTTNQIVTGGC